MKKYLYGLMACCCFINVAQAGDVVKTVYVNRAPVSNTSFYAAVRGGLNMGTVKAEDEKLNKNSFFVSGALGNQIVDFSTGALRGEMEYTYNDTISEKDAKYDSQLLIANVYYDFNINSTVTPYVGAGLGVAFNDGEYNGYSDNSTSFVYSLSAGITLPVNEKINFDLGYRYLNMTDSDITIDGQDIKIKPYSHQVMAGVRVSF